MSVVHQKFSLKYFANRGKFALYGITCSPVAPFVMHGPDIHSRYAVYSSEHYGKYYIPINCSILCRELASGSSRREVRFPASGSSGSPCAENKLSYNFSMT